MVKAEFEFTTQEGLGFGESVACLGDGHLAVRIWRRMRTDPLTGMKQPLLNHAIMGLEGVMDITIKGTPVAGLRWRLYRGRRLVQLGRTDANGRSGELDIEIEPDRLRLVVFQKGRS